MARRFLDKIPKLRSVSLLFVIGVCAYFVSTYWTASDPLSVNKLSVKTIRPPPFSCTSARTYARDRNLVVKGASVLTMADGDKTVIRNGVVHICDGIITFVGNASAHYHYSTQKPNGYCKAKELLLYEDDVVVPAFINGHTHAAMSLFKNLGNDRELNNWLYNYIFKLEGSLVDEQFCRVGAKLAMAEFLASGTSTFADMYFYTDAVAEEVAEVGMRAILGENVIDYSQPDAPTPNVTLKYGETYLRKWSGHPLVRPMLAPHAPYTTSAWVYREAVKLNRKYNAPTWTHCSESPFENENLRVHQNLPNDSSITATKFFDDIGVLGPDVVCAHSVWLTDDDIARYKRTGTKVAHCPSSNLKLASGIMPYSRIHEAGVPISIGTDGHSSNNDVDLVAEAQLASLLHKGVNLNPTTLPAYDALRHLTIEGAEVIMAADKQGSLEVGKVGDLTIFRGGSVKWTPRFDIGTDGTFSADDTAALITYDANAYDVGGTVIDGKLLYYNGCYTTLDVNRVLEEAAFIGHEIRKFLANTSATT